MAWIIYSALRSRRQARTTHRDTGEQTSCCAFGGPNLDTLYITSAALSEITSEVPIGYNPEVGYLGGSLYRTRVEVQGRVQPKADIVLTRNSA
jgi:sugar lactone lactonase YvrE